jgi:hypothetical protein
VAAGLVGLYTLFGAEEAAELERERATGFGVVVGTAAVVGSLYADARALWYCTPRRWRLYRDGR